MPLFSTRVQQVVGFRTGNQRPSRDKASFAGENYHRRGGSCRGVGNAFEAAALVCHNSRPTVGWADDAGCFTGHHRTVARLESR